MRNTITLSLMILALESQAGSPWFNGTNGNFAYGGKTSAKFVASDAGQVLQYSGDPTAYSGYQLTAPQPVDLRGRDSLALEFRVRTPLSDEALFVGLEDTRSVGEKRYHTRLPLSSFTRADSAWRVARIPLAAFSAIGEHWDMKKNAGEEGVVDWAQIRGLRITTDPEPGRTSLVQAEFGPIEVVTLPKAERKPAKPPMAGPQASPAKDPRAVFFDGSLPAGIYQYAYGEKSMVDLRDNSSAKGRSLLVVSLDDHDYSGAALLLPQPMDISAQKSKLALSFHVRAEKGPASFDVCLLDDESAGKNRPVETHVRIQDRTKVQGDWVHVVVPLKDFPDNGTSWNAETHSVFPAKFDWSHFRGVRLSAERNANRHLTHDGTMDLMLDQVTLVQAQ